MIWSEPCIAFACPRELRDDEQAKEMAQSIAHHLIGQMAELAGRKPDPDARLTFRFQVALEQL
jgi:hypothetical protein